MPDQWKALNGITLTVNKNPGVPLGVGITDMVITRVDDGKPAMKAGIRARMGFGRGDVVGFVVKRVGWYVES